MSNNEPTQEQIKEFWEKLGARYVPLFHCDTCLHEDAPYWLIKGISHRIYLAELMTMVDLNNLFKYAVPKLEREYLHTHIIFEQDRTEPRICAVQILFNNKLVGTGESNNPALALFWAIWEVIHGK